MNLKTSCFNIPFFRANIKRFWWIGVLYFIGYLTFGVMPLAEYEGIWGFVGMNCVGMIMAALMTVIFFSYLDFNGSTSFMHSFPVKRRANFITNIISIYVILLVPAVIAYGAGIVFCMINDYYRLRELFDAFLVLIPLITFAAAFSSVGVMATGNAIAAVAFSAIFMGLPFYGEALIRAFIEQNVHGIYSKGIYLIESFNVYRPTAFMIILGIVSLIILYPAWLLYKNRPLESSGDIISYKFLKPVFIAGVSVFSGLLGYFYLYESTGKNSFLYLIPFGLLGVVISYMLSKKAFTFKGIWKPGMVYLIGVLLAAFSIKADITGFERRVPDPSNIAAVTIIDNPDFYLNTDRILYYKDNEYRYKNPVPDDVFMITDPEEIKSVTEAHKAFSKNRSNSGTESFPIIYKLKNGRTMKRFYNVSFRSDADLLRPIYTSPAIRNMHHPSLVFDDVIPISLTVSDERLSSPEKVYDIYTGSSDEGKALFDAIRADFAEAGYEDIVSDRNSLTTITLSYTRPVIKIDGKETDSSYDTPEQSDFFGIPSSYKRTVGLLKEYGLYDKTAKPEDIAYIVLRFDYARQALEKISDREKINELYEYVSEGHKIPGPSAAYSENGESGPNANPLTHSISLYFLSADNTVLFSVDEIDSLFEAPPESLLEEDRKYNLSISNGTLDKLYPQSYGDLEFIS